MLQHSPPPTYNSRTTPTRSTNRSDIEIHARNKVTFGKMKIRPPKTESFMSLCRLASLSMHGLDFSPTSDIRSMSPSPGYPIEIAMRKVRTRLTSHATKHFPCPTPLTYIRADWIQIHPSLRARVRARHFPPIILSATWDKAANSAVDQHEGWHKQCISWESQPCYDFKIWRTPAGLSVDDGTTARDSRWSGLGPESKENIFYVLHQNKKMAP